MTRPTGQYRWPRITEDADTLATLIRGVVPGDENFEDMLDSNIERAELIAAHLRQVRDEIKEGENAETSTFTD